MLCRFRRVFWLLSEKHAQKTVGPLRGLVPHLPEHTGGNGAGGHLPGDVQRPHVLREGIGGEGLLPAMLVAVGKPQPVGVELYPPGLPVLPIQLRIDLLCFILLGMIVFQ